MGMTIDGLEKECQYCYREIDNSGLEGFRCTNRTAIKARASSWCYPKNANEPCSTCEFCEIKDDKECLFYETCSPRTAVCKVRQPDMECPVYRYFKGLIVKDSEARLKADMAAMLNEVKAEIMNVYAYNNDSKFVRMTCRDIVQEKINALKENSHDD